MSVYAPVVMPINGRSEWKKSTYMPPLPQLVPDTPNTGSTLGRPQQNKRRLEPDEQVNKGRKRSRGKPPCISKRKPNKIKRYQRTCICKYYEKEGHNTKGCQEKKDVIKAALPNEDEQFGANTNLPAEHEHLDTNTTLPTEEGQFEANGNEINGTQISTTDGTNLSIKSNGKNISNAVFKPHSTIATTKMKRQMSFLSMNFDENNIAAPKKKKPVSFQSMYAGGVSITAPFEVPILPMSTIVKAGSPTKMKSKGKASYAPFKPHPSTSTGTNVWMNHLSTFSI